MIEYVGVALLIGVYIQLFVYYKWSIKRIDAVKDEMYTIRTNDLHHIEKDIKQIRDHVFDLAKGN